MRRRLTTITCSIAASTAALLALSLGMAPATAEAQTPSITPTITCDALGGMTISVQIDGKLPDQDVTVSYRAPGVGGGGLSMSTASLTYPTSVNANQALRLWVEVDGTTAYDSGELYSSVDAGCGVTAPAVGEGIAIVPSSTCTGGGVDYGVTIDAHQLIHYVWKVGSVQDSGDKTFTGTDTINKVIPAGTPFSLYLVDFLDREIWNSGQLAAGAGADCSEPAAEAADAHVTLTCVDGTIQAVPGATNTGNVTLDVKVRGEADGVHLPTKSATLEPGETLALDPVVVVDAHVVTARVDTGGKEIGSTTLDTATVTVTGAICESVPPVTTPPVTTPPVTTTPVTTPPVTTPPVTTPPVTTTPVTTTPVTTTPVTTVPVATPTTAPHPTPTPGTPGATIPVATTVDPTTTVDQANVEPRTPVGVEPVSVVAGTGLQRALPRTGSDHAGPVALGLGLLAVGAAMAASGRRRARRS